MEIDEFMQRVEEDRWWFDERCDRFGEPRTPAAERIELTAEAAEDRGAAAGALGALLQRRQDVRHSIALAAQASRIALGVDGPDAEEERHYPDDAAERLNALDQAIAFAGHGQSYQRALLGWFDQLEMYREVMSRLDRDSPAVARLLGVVWEVAQDDLEWHAERTPGDYPLLFRHAPRWVAQAIARIAHDDVDAYGAWCTTVRAIFAHQSRPNAPEPLPVWTRVHGAFSQWRPRERPPSTDAP
jgi:hypothetical protein